MKLFDHNSGEYLDTNGAKIYYEVHGDENAPVLMFLHGGFGDIEDFNAIIPDFKRDFRIIGVDSRGQGKSTLGAKTLTYELLQSDVKSVLRHLNVDICTIIGFSDGGIVANRLASLSSLKIEKLVTIGARWKIENTEPLKETFLETTANEWKAQFPENYDFYQRYNPEPNFEILVKSLVKMWLDSSGYPDDEIANIACPLLIVRGDDDQNISRQDVVDLSKLVKGSKILNVPYAEHPAFVQQKEVFMISVNEFLGE